MAVRQVLESRVAHLEEELLVLHERVGHLEERLAAGAVEKPEKTKARRRAPAEGGGGSSEELLTWAGRTSLLPRVATVCFIMVLALALRTATDNELIDQQVGTLLGVLYAGALMLNGWFLYSRGSAQAPVVTVSGAFLMFAVVVETQAHFKSLPPIPAYLVLMTTGGLLSLISHRYQKALPIIAGTLVMCIGGVTVDFPNPIFSYLTPLLLFANVLGFYATRLKRCSWLRWFVFVLTVCVLQVWAFKLGIFLVKGLEPPEPLSPYWFFPIMILFGCAFVASSYFGIVREEEKASKFDFGVPTLSAIWIYWACYYVVSRGGGDFAALGIVAVASAAAHYWIAFGLARRREAAAPGINAFVLAGSVWLVCGLALWSQDLVFPLPLASLVALGIALKAHQWRSGSARLTSYLLQGYIGLAIVWSLHDRPSGHNYMAIILATGAIALTALAHYYWLRRHPPGPYFRFFAKHDPHDRTAVIVLLTGLVAGFYQARSMLFEFLHVLPGNNRDIFICSQSILINTAVIVLMVLALRHKNRELRNVAILITLLGAGKVFMVDLLNTKGIPLVLSVLSFGVVASAESWILTRWQRSERSAEDTARAEHGAPAAGG